MKKQTTNMIWLLQKNHDNTLNKPIGPYPWQEVVNFLKTGHCSDRDFVWGEGFKEWKRISLVPGFPTHPAHTIEDILISQARKYHSQKPRSIRYLTSSSAYPTKDKYQLFTSL